MTSSTEESRAARSAAAGTSNGARAAASVRLARTIRWATVASPTRNARAISAVLSAPTSRSVSATRASVESTGWQAMKIRLSRSSPMSSSIAAARSGSSACSSERPISACLRSAIAPWRRRSIARCLAVAMSQAPGFSGTPDSGHCSSAATSASCARSSATPTSRTMRARPAISRADSIRQTASMARWASNSVARRLLAQARLLLAQLGGELLAEVLGLEDLADLDLRLGLHRVGAALDPLDRLFERLDLDDPEARDELLRLGERAVDDAALVGAEAHARALRARVQALARQHHAGLDQLLVVGAHRGEQLLARQHAGLGLVGRLDHDHEAHVGVLSLGVHCSRVEREEPESTAAGRSFHYGGCEP